MKKFGFATIIASGLAAAVLGLAGTRPGGCHPSRLDLRHPASGDRAARRHQRPPEPLTTRLNKRGARHRVPLLSC